MKVLILGGRQFLGRHIVDACLEKGFAITLFNRGKTNPELFSNLESLTGDREKDLGKLKDRSWDVVIDTCGYSPDNLETVAKELSGNVKHYIFISSCSVYEHFPKNRILGEDAEIVNLEIDRNKLEPMGKDYGACKYLSERAVDSNFNGIVTHIRPGLIVGPNDITARFPYWVQRLSKGGATLAPSSPEAATQIIDVRDLAQWCAHVAEKQIVGIFNATGERKQLGDVLSKMNEALGGKSSLKWACEDFLKSHDVKCWTELPLWVFEEIDIFLSWDSKKAKENGLKYRAIEETTIDTLDWLKGTDFESLKSSSMEPERETDLLEKLKNGQFGSAQNS